MRAPVRRPSALFRRLLPVVLAAWSCGAPPSVEVDRLVADLNAEPWQDRAAAAAALGRLGAEQATPALRRALADDAAEVRASAAAALGRLGAASARDELRARIREDEHPKVVVAALLALPVVAADDLAGRRRDLDMLVDRLADDRRGVDAAARRALFTLAGRGSIAEQIRTDLRSGTDETRARASRMARKLALPELAGWERTMFRDPSPDVRGDAYDAVLLDLSSGDYEALVAGLNDTSASVRVTAAMGLGELRDPAAVPPLTRATGADLDAEVREAAAEAIASIRRIPGRSLPAVWHFERIADRVTVDADGACTWTRSLALVVDAAPEPIDELALLLPRDFPQASSVTDARGSALGFRVDANGPFREVVFRPSPLEPGVAATFTISGRSRRPVSSGGSGEALIRYAPGPFQARIRALRVVIAGPAGGEAATLDRAEVEPGDAGILVLRASVPASGLDLRQAPAGEFTRQGELTMLALVVALVLLGMAATIVRLRRTMVERADRAVLVAALTTGALVFLTPILVEDNLPYYAWARSAVFDGDLDRADEYTEFNSNRALAPSNRDVQDPIFASLFDAPFVVAANGLTPIVNAVIPGHAPNGFSFPYLFLMALGDFFAVLLGCLACFSLVERRVGRRFALFGVLSTVAGTNLLLFAYAWTGGSFQPSFLLASVFINHWDKTEGARRPRHWLVAGVLLGLLGMTRTLNWSFALIPLLAWPFGAAAGFRKSGVRGLAAETGLGALLMLGMVVGYAPQLLAHRMLDGAFTVDAYGVGSGRFAGLRDSLGELFVGLPDGLFPAMPLLALAFVGLLPLMRAGRLLGASLAATLAVQLVFIASYEIYWGRFLFGTPYLVPSTAIFCLGMASLMKAAVAIRRRAGPVVLWGAAALCAARNGWCMLHMLGRDLIGPHYEDLGAKELVHGLLMLEDRKLEVDGLGFSSEFGCLLRELVGGLAAWDPGRVLGALGWASLLIAPVVGAYLVRERVGSWFARGPRAALRRFGAGALVLVWLAAMGWIAALSSRTDVDFAYASDQLQEWPRDFALRRIEPGQSHSWWFALANPADRFSAITFLTGAADVPQGEPVATVELISGETVSRFELRAGVDTADYGVDRPESRAWRAHTAPLDRASFSWRVGDDSNRFYTARAYRSVFATGAATRPTAMKLTSLMSHGAIEVLVTTARERKLPRDRERWRRLRGVR